MGRMTAVPATTYPWGMASSVLVLGAGFGGLELSSRLSEALGDQVDITLIDRADAFVFGFSTPSDCTTATSRRRASASVRNP